MFFRSEDPEYKANYKAYLPAVIWTLNLDGTPIYALRPDGTFARETHEAILNFYEEQIQGKSDRAVFPGTLKGSARLFSGQVVPIICPEVRGMANWKTKDVVEASTKELVRAKRVQTSDDADVQLTGRVAGALQTDYRRKCWKTLP
jgi:hypothetical protein